MKHLTDSGFSLLEMLVVILIISIIATFAVPVVTGINRSSQLARGTQIVADQLAIARQTAITRNRQVEVRFFKFADPEQPMSRNCFRGLQVLEVINPRAISPLDKMQPLPTNVIIDASAALSSLLDPAQKTAVPGADQLPRVGTNYQYVSLRFRPDGSTDLLPTKGPWFLTLHEEIYGDGLTRPPANFTTLEIDPINGSVKFYRPGL
jgi:uncharacterized protein (TIGR02596 family)